ncbi:MAG TPA: hypothetical protein DGT23_20545 [Micromonosporaceae bacterium]|nr:hypothetical protein [Micromonosporaceae bacterium]
MSGEDSQVDNQPYAEITQAGRWTYHIVIHDDLFAPEHPMAASGYGVWYGPWYALGKTRAERKAARVLARYIRDQRRRAQKTIVKPDLGVRP